ncbi:hypothetical protein EI427_23465 [Flammeovirga pectinis]|uniref:Fibronectin type-III domain-containing protein n=1 Tax=Flammeovirga pectinis TaxID=2494373 RepID=A0A3Q9FQE7_9BACT|nr:polymorphic toxin-type HINT domain-containing protein [Flammeovirga pectinis]AZQ65175.1 hypothetical protein EI427_23465 [Flammeovirga pectinis]
MKNSNYIYTLLLVLLISSSTLFAQRYPVQATLTLTAPYPVKLSEYTQLGSNKVQATIWLKDLGQSDIPVKFKLRIENTQKRLLLETKQNYNPEPVHLVGGQTELLDATVLGPYFELNNLSAVSGSTSAIVSNGGRLPDGYYKFTLEVLDFYTGRKISNTSLYQCFLVLSDPPLLMLPANARKVIASDPQYVNFSWNPRHLVSPNRPQNVTYRFQVVEILREGQTAGDAFATTPPIIDEEGIMVPAYQLGPMDSPLEPGNWYAWRVQAYDEDELGLIKNEGWSAPQLFQFGDACKACEQFAVANTTENRAELFWLGDFSHDSYEVKYRRKADKDEDPLPWKAQEFLAVNGVVKRLTDGTIYEFKVRGICNGERYGEWSAIQEASTELKPKSTYSCEGGEVAISWENEEPYTLALEVGEIFTAGDFDVIIVEDDIIDGKHMGNGMIRIQAFEAVYFNVEWEDIVLNTDYQLIEGEALIIGSDSDLIDPELKTLITQGLGALDMVIEGVKFVKKVINNLPEDIKNDFNTAKDSVAIQKRELSNTKKALRQAERALKNIEEEGTAKEIAEAQDVVDGLLSKKEIDKEDLLIAKSRKKEAVKKALDYVTQELQQGVQYFVQFSNGINSTLQATNVDQQKREAEKTFVAGDSLIAFLTRLEGESNPSSDALKMAKTATASQESIERTLEDMLSLINMSVDIINIGFPTNETDYLELGLKVYNAANNLVNSGQESADNVESISSMLSISTIPEAITATKMSVWVFKFMFENIYMLVGSKTGEVQNGQNWAETDRLYFSSSSATAYGFDAGGRTVDKNAHVEVSFETEENYIIPWVAAEGTQEVTVAISGTIDNIIFSSEDKTLTAEAIDGVVKLQSKKDNKSTEWQAYRMVNNKEEYYGKINVQPYEKQQYTLRLYAVNGQELPDKETLQNYLNTIYGTALIEWTVVIEATSDMEYADRFWDITTEDGKVEVGSSTTLTGYTYEQKYIINYFKDNYAKPKGNEFVLFYAGGSSVADVSGYMMLSGRYGFIFNNGSTPTFRTIAHELGHGAFGLEHTWMEYPNEEGFAQETTNNLMDYGIGEELWKWQWDLVQNPAPTVGFENEDEDGQSVSEDKLAQIVRMFNEISCANSRGENLLNIELSITDGNYTFSTASLLDELNLQGFEAIRGNNITIRVPNKNNSGTLREYAYFNIQNSQSYEYSSSNYQLVKIGDDLNNILILSGKYKNSGLLEGFNGSPLDENQINLFKELFKKITNHEKGEYNLIGNYASEGDIDIEQVKKFTTCDFELLSRSVRLDLIKLLSTNQSGFFDDDTYQLCSVKSLATIDDADKEYFYNEFSSHPEYIINQYNSLDGLSRSAFVQEVYTLWKLFENETDEKAVLIVGASFRGNVVNSLKFDDDKTIYEERQGKLIQTYATSGGGYGSRYDKVKFTIGDIFTPVSFYIAKEETSSKNAVIIPAIVLKSFTDDQNFDHTVDMAFLTADLVSLAFGVGEFNLLLKGARSSSFLSKQFLITSLRASLSIVDLTATVNDIVCSTDEFSQSNFCNTWNEYALYVQLGILSASALDMFAGRLLKDLNELPPSTRKQLEDEGVVSSFGGCFVAGTPVYQNGEIYKNIEEIKEGDFVDSFDENNNIVLSKVTNTFIRQSSSLRHFYSQQKLLFSSTPEHPIFTPANFRKARDLIEGDSIWSQKGWLVISEIIDETASVDVYNFTVENTHTYFVGSSAVGVHNRSVALSPALEKKVAEIKALDADLGQELETLINNDHYALAFVGDIGLVDNWFILTKGGGSPVIRKNIDNLKGLSSFVASKGNFSDVKIWNECVDKINNHGSKEKLIKKLDGKTSPDEILRVIGETKSYPVPHTVFGDDRIKQLMLNGDKKAKGYSELLDSDLSNIPNYTKYKDQLDNLAEGTDAANIRSKVVKEFNEQLGQTANSIDELTGRLSKIDNQGSRGAICESYVATKKNLSITGVVHPQIDFPAFSKKRIPDGIFHVDAQGKLVIYDVKSGYVNGQIDVEQLEDYAKMIKILSSKGEEADLLKQILKEKGINMSGFRGKVEVQYIVMPGKTNQVDIAKEAIEKKKNTFFDNNKTLSPIREKVIITQDL